MPFEKKQGILVFNPNKVELAALKTWGISGVVRMFLKWDGSDFIDTPDQERKFEEAKKRAFHEATGAVDAYLRQTTNTDYIRSIIDARTRGGSNESLE